MEDKKSNVMIYIKNLEKNYHFVSQLIEMLTKDFKGRIYFDNITGQYKVEDEIWRRFVESSYMLKALNYHYNPENEMFNKKVEARTLFYKLKEEYSHLILTEKFLDEIKSNIGKCHKLVLNIPNVKKLTLELEKTENGITIIGEHLEKVEGNKNGFITIDSGKKIEEVTGKDAHKINFVYLD